MNSIGLALRHRLKVGARQVWRALPGRHSIATRLVVTLSMLACLSTSLSLVVHDALSGNLEAAARARLDGAATAAERLLANFLGETLVRWQALSRTPEFRANLEVASRSTLRYFARDLASAQRASLVVFQDRRAKPLAVAGDAALENAAREILTSHVAFRDQPGAQSETLHCVELRASAAKPTYAPRIDFKPCTDLKGHASATLFGHEGTGYVLIRVPLVTQGRSLGELIVSERVPEELLADWSSVIGATLALETHGDTGDELAADVLRVPGLVARVRTSNDAERQALISTRWRMVAAGGFAVSVALLVASWLGSTLARPIQELRDATVRAGRGDLDVRVDAARHDELGEVARAFNLTLENLRHSRDRLYKLAYYDPLTNVGNRRSFQEELARRLQSEADRSSPLALMIVDLAKFKAVNDTLGIVAGDEVLNASGRPHRVQRGRLRGRGADRSMATRGQRVRDLARQQRRRSGRPTHPGLRSSSFRRVGSVDTARCAYRHRAGCGSVPFCFRGDAGL